MRKELIEKFWAGNALVFIALLTNELVTLI